VAPLSFAQTSPAQCVNWQHPPSNPLTLIQSILWPPRSFSLSLFLLPQALHKPPLFTSFACLAGAPPPALLISGPPTLHVVYHQNQNQNQSQPEPSIENKLLPTQLQTELLTCLCGRHFGFCAGASVLPAAAACPPAARSLWRASAQSPPARRASAHAQALLSLSLVEKYTATWGKTKLNGETVSPLSQPFGSFFSTVSLAAHSLDNKLAKRMGPQSCETFTKRDRQTASCEGPPSLQGPA